MRGQFYIVKLESFTIEGLPTRAKKGLPTEVTFWTFWSHFKHCAAGGTTILKPFSSSSFARWIKQIFRNRQNQFYSAKPLMNFFFIYKHATLHELMDYLMKGGFLITFWKSAYFRVVPLLGFKRVVCNKEAIFLNIYF